jgi:hypothetical protein
MSDTHVGKLSPSRTHGLLSDALGARSDSLIVGPGPGLDAAVLDLGDGRVMAVAEDPIFPAVGLPLETFGEFTVHIGASDVAVMGVRPQFMTYSLLLPPGFAEDDTRTIIPGGSDCASSAATSTASARVVCSVSTRPGRATVVASNDYRLQENIAGRQLSWAPGTGLLSERRARRRWFRKG